ncbi:Sarcosine oxidase subunit alpha [Rhodovastum atsumiense]|uniref:Sarcosine oxidase subunit alpha family protein n=1 Tax=Rhodovastum atsumiense TaxID=504468 RepID=A0A5M6J204_9PROT|nr:sarcosine oxidase subunit alpha family protein [Rhodovastum atsumiense]KAA5614117.1 sarcosine oxidase subunit alpha family protein [Rhodovastum atsumiense]CAH2598962.1 Sarcosine oxidase subunit alpha [Rhodovastum atsumiense]
MSPSFRTASGGRIDRGRKLRFSFDGRSYIGYQGDTLASALLGNGVHLLARSYKFHRPRGILAAGSDEPNALVGVGRDEAHYSPNLRATQVELYEGLKAESQNRWPSLRFDLGALAGLAGPFMPPGFYYKTFMWPRGAWDKFYEPRLRALAGLGRAPVAADADRYVSRYAHADVLVVGGGPAGLAAALAAAEAGARVILCDEQAEFGGSLLADTTATIDGRPAALWLADTLAALHRHERVRLFSRTTAFGYYPHNMVGLAERVTDHLAGPDPALPRERLWQVRAREIVFAAGALERPLVFPGNDRPGVMLADAARTYATRYGVRCGTRAVIVTAHDEAYRAALDLNHAGIAIVAIADIRPAPGGPLVEAARAAGLPVRTATTIAGTRGRLRVAGATLAPLGGDGAPEPVACDLVLMSGGFTPSVHLFSQTRGTLRFDAARQIYLPGASVEHERSAGACRGVFGLAAALADGTAAGEGAARAAGFGGAAPRSFAVAGAETGTGGHIGSLPQRDSAVSGEAFVDFQSDVTARDLVLATREGFHSIEHVKRYTATGMATDQGKTSNMNALGIVSQVLGREVEKVGLTTFRPPYTPVTFGGFAGLARGDLFEPIRTTPIHDWAVAQGAVFEDVGMWKRARYFPRGTETMDEAVARECRAVRGGVGLFDASTLGKIEVVGPDAAEFMNRMYVNAWTKLAPGRCRYGVMLREEGFVLDDGVVGRIAADRFHVTTTTGGAARVLALMEDYLQTEWQDLRVWLTSTTEQWAVIAVQGPKARLVLQDLVEGVDLSAQTLPHMAVVEGRIHGVPMRLFRVSFSGELGFEVNVPAAHGRAVWEAIHAAGQPHGITPYGTETMHVLRAEKGYIIVGQETDGTVTPDDAGLSWAIAKTKVDFVGKRSLSLPAMRDPARKQVVGLLTEDPGIVLEEGAHLTVGPGAVPPVRALGHVTSAYFSATLGRSIALALISGGRALVGQTIHVSLPGRDIPVKVTSPVFYDPEGARLDA